eukprot:g760.t1
MKGTMTFYKGSELYIEWVVQHGCGEPPTAIQANEPALGQHEPLSFYLDCKARERQKGLYTADQNVNNDRGATATRQNPNGNNAGHLASREARSDNGVWDLACLQERDYYPYWHPTPWHDIAIITDESPRRCEYYQKESQNVHSKGYCSEPEHNNPESCQDAGAEWKDPWLSSHIFSNALLEAGLDAGDDYFHVNKAMNDPAPGQRRRTVFKGGPPILPQDPVGDWLDLGEDYRLQLQVNTNQYGRTFEDRSAKGSNSLFALPLCFKDTYLLR